MPGAGARTGFTPEADATAASWYGWGQHTLACWWPGAAVRSTGLQWAGRKEGKATQGHRRRARMEEVRGGPEPGPRGGQEDKPSGYCQRGCKAGRCCARNGRTGVMLSVVRLTGPLPTCLVFRHLPIEATDALTACRRRPSYAWALTGCGRKRHSYHCMRLVCRTSSFFQRLWQQRGLTQTRTHGGRMQSTAPNQCGKDAAESVVPLDMVRLMRSPARHALPTFGEAWC